MAKVPDAQVMADLEGVVQWAGAHGGNSAKVAITGFCWGGRITGLYAAHGAMKAAVAWYGGLVICGFGIHLLDSCLTIMGLKTGASIVRSLTSNHRHQLWF